MAMKRRKKKSQSVIEYTLLVAIAVAGLVAVAYFMVDLSDGPFSNHFKQVRLRIIGR
jgi:hypothetical protein